MPHKSFLTRTQTTKIGNTTAKNMSTDIKLSKTQLSKMIQTSRVLHNILDNLGKKVIIDLAIDDFGVSTAILNNTDISRR